MLRSPASAWCLMLIVPFAIAACSDDSDPSGGSGGGNQGGAGVGGSSSTSTSNTSTGNTSTSTGNTTTSTGTGSGMCAGGPLAAPIPNCAPAPLPSTGDIHQDCVDRINQLRYECQCLPPLERWTAGENCANTQSAQDQASNSAHGNFGDCGENAQNTCPNWNNPGHVVGGCLQAMWDEGPGEPFSEHGHYINMTNPGYGKVACGFSTSGAGTWSNQNFAP